MKIVRYAAVILTALTVQAIAADEVVPTEFSWTGGYLGLQGGYGWGDVDDYFPANPDIEFEGRASGFAAGLYGGWNWQTGNFVFGTDADFNLSKAEDTTIVDLGFGAYDALITDFDWTGSIRGRLGYVVGRTQVYAAAGAAFADVNIEMYNDVRTFLTKSETLTGWTVGAGVETAFTDNLVGRLEYRYANYGEIDYRVGGGAGSIDLDMNSVTAGLAFKF